MGPRPFGEHEPKTQVVCFSLCPAAVVFKRPSACLPRGFADTIGRRAVERERESEGEKKRKIRTEGRKATVKEKKGSREGNKEIPKETADLIAGLFLVMRTNM